MLYKRFIIIMVILALLILASVATAARIDPTQRPVPPHIQTYAIPAGGGEPAECAGAAGCGVMCFYVTEDATENQYELSCVAWVFE